jgi:hypothetical protein
VQYRWRLDTTSTGDACLDQLVNKAGEQTSIAVGITVSIRGSASTAPASMRTENRRREGMSPMLSQRS